MHKTWPHTTVQPAMAVPLGWRVKKVLYFNNFDPKPNENRPLKHYLGVGFTPVDKWRSSPSAYVIQRVAPRMVLGDPHGGSLDRVPPLESRQPYPPKEPKISIFGPKMMISGLCTHQKAVFHAQCNLQQLFLCLRGMDIISADKT